MKARPPLCIVKGSGAVETFVRAHADGLPASVTLIHDLPPRIHNRPVLSQALPSRAWRKALRVLQRREVRSSTGASPGISRSLPAIESRRRNSPDPTEARREESLARRSAERRRPKAE